MLADDLLVRPIDPFDGIPGPPPIPANGQVHTIPSTHTKPKRDGFRVLVPSLSWQSTGFFVCLSRACLGKASVSLCMSSYYDDLIQKTAVQW
jgi:hypothetical protein